MAKIDLSTIPELKGLPIITDQEGLDAFLRNLRQDYYSPAKLAEFNLSQELDSWLKSRKPNAMTFFAVYNEKNDLAKNDGWGHYELFRCVAIRTDDGKIHFLKTLIKEFHH